MEEARSVRPIDRLQREWARGARALHIGKAESLPERVGELLGFADGAPVRHWGGWLLRQLELRGARTRLAR